MKGVADKDQGPVDLGPAERPSQDGEGRCPSVARSAQRRDGCSRRTRASERRAGAPSIAVAMLGVKRKLRRARTSERQDSRAMRYKVHLLAIDIKAS